MRLASVLLLFFATISYAKDIRLSNRFLDIAVDPANGALRVTAKRSRGAWEQKPFKQAPAVRKATKAGNVITCLLDGYEAKIALDRTRPEIDVTVSGEGPLKQLLGFPLPFVTGKGTSLVVPLNEGILYPVEDGTIGQRQLIAYGGHGISMPWFGVFDGATGAGMMAIIETPDDARIEITRQSGTGLFIRPLWEASRQEPSSRPTTIAID